ncbi:MAG: PGF-pre-PGF domain-containing protein, partial [Halobacteriales archaeon]
EGSTDGTYTATLTTAEDAAGNDGAAGQQDAVTVDTTTSSSPDLIDDSEEVGVERRSGGVEISVPAGTIDPVVVDGERTDSEGPLADAGNVSLDRLELAVDATSDRQLTVTVYDDGLRTGDATAPEAVTDAAADFETATDTVAAGYVHVEHDLDAADASNVTVTFGVAKRHLDALGVDPDEVALYRYHDGDWARLSTARRGGNATHYRFEATAPGLSVFAVGTGAPRLAVTGTELSDARVTEGAAATVTATVHNRGTAAVDRTVSVTADGEVLESATVHLDGGEAETVSLEVAPPAGEWDLAVEETAVGTLVVTADETPTGTPSPASETPTGGETPAAGHTSTGTATTPATTAGTAGSRLGWLLTGLAAIVLAGAALALRGRDGASIR